jgi:hypothetical protein
MKHAAKPIAQSSPSPAAATATGPNLRSVLIDLARVLGRQAAAEFIRAAATPSLT